MRNSRIAWLLAGIGAGLVLGLNMAGIWPQVPLHAVATHGQENFAICTAPMDDNVEAIFVLDDTTGDLKAACLNVQMRRFNTFFDYNVLQDLPTPNAKNGRYRIVSGVANIRQNVAAGQMARSVVYVAEVTTGQIVAYGVPWVPGRASSMVPFNGTIIPLDRWQFRTTAIRNP